MPSPMPIHHRNQPPFRLRAGLSIAHPVRLRADEIERSVMRKCFCSILACCWFGQTVNEAVTFLEDFGDDPATRSWRALGDRSLFRWNGTNQHLEVTWDSSRPNSYF